MTYQAETKPMHETYQTERLSAAAGVRRRLSNQGAVRDKLWIGLALLAVYLIWGSTYLGIRVALEGFPPFLMAGVRFAIAGGALYLWLRARGAPAPSRAQWGGGALLGLLLLAGGNGGVTFAEQWVASGLAALSVATVPLWAALFAGLLGHWPGRIEWLGLALGFAGVVLLNLEGDMRAQPLGALILALAAMSWAFGTVWSRRMTLPAGLMSSAVGMLAAGPMLLLLGLASGERITSLPAARPLLALGYLIVAALFAFSAYNYLLRRVRPALATSYAYVNPPVAVALGVWLAGERIGSHGLLAMLVILAGVALVMLGGKRDS
jgi:drug/metabolite transporter (DMT)-like permease